MAIRGLVESLGMKNLEKSAPAGEPEGSLGSSGKGVQKTGEKDWWGRVKVTVEIVIAITGLTFTFLYNQSNTRLQRMQIQSTLVFFRPPIECGLLFAE